jgi:hypothetical protein
MGSDHRLTTRQMAEFVANGFPRFDAIVPADVNERLNHYLEYEFVFERRLELP